MQSRETSAGRLANPGALDLELGPNPVCTIKAMTYSRDHVLAAEQRPKLLQLDATAYTQLRRCFGNPAAGYEATRAHAEEGVRCRLSFTRCHRHRMREVLLACLDS